MSDQPSDFTAALIAYRDGETRAFERLVDLAYEDLKRIAHRQRRRAGSADAPVQTTALVHETYLRLVDQSQTRYNDRGHFFAAWARAMRHVLVDEARRRATQKRGGGSPNLPLEEGKAAGEQACVMVLEVHEALNRLADRDPRLQQIVECRFFAGLTEPETAEALQTSLRSVQRGWWKARAWLGQELGRTST
ncbi:MAG: ECF-type sigma factor [Thermoanaerobaculia bacterium]